MSTFGCGTNRPIIADLNHEMVPGYEIIIRLSESGNDKAMDVFIRNGRRIAGVQQKYLSTEKHEMRMTIKGATGKLLNELEYHLKEVLNVESVLIIRI